MLDAVPQGKMILLDYYCENKEVWKFTDGFYGQPYIWCYLGNFGGNTYLKGNIKTVNNSVTELLNGCQKGKVQGVGLTLEALDIMNPMMYEFVMEKAWDCSYTDVNDWICKYAQRRCGRPDGNVEKAWQILLQKVYSQASSRWHGIESLRPTIKLSEKKRNKSNSDYDNLVLLKVWGLMLKAENKSTDAYLTDLVNIACETLGNYAFGIETRMMSDYKAQDIGSFKKSSSEFLGVIAEIDRLAGSRRERLLGKWLNDARSFGVNTFEQKYYEQNARNILTTWGDKNQMLNDYAKRDWAGLIKGFYLKRWQMFVKALEKSLKNKTAFDETKFRDKITEFEWKWTLSNERYSDKPIGDSWAIAKELYDKYADKISCTTQEQN